MQTLDPEHWLPKFGLTAFRAGQRQVIDAILAGRDTLCIMPTGGGKSLCYQLPTMARDGVTIVISPLIALMKDQVDSLNEVGIPATYINSSLAPAQQQSRTQGMIDGEYKLVYVAPERLRSNSFLRATHQTKIQLLAVDEAHCISHWGHDFRPDYSRLGRFRTRIGNPQTMALTATATTLVQQDIAKILELRDPATFVTGFARSNLHISVVSPKSNSEKDQHLIDYLNSIEGCGIIYASTRKNCEHLVELLRNDCSRSVAFYHAGMAADVRRKVQEEFMSGEIEIIVATNAFGMGIDKSNLRFVIHYNLPGSIEAYYQEAGRAGRDGHPSRCVMLYSFQDKFIQEFFIENSYPSRAVIKQVYEYLRSIDAAPVEMTLQDIKDDLGLQIGTSGIGNCENLLERANAIERLDSVQNSAAIRIDSDLPTLVDFLPREARTQRMVLRELERLCENFRNERVLFSPQRLAQTLDMKWESVNRAIRQLVKLPMIDFIPPFRGRAIHVINRKLRFEELSIDFDELQRRKEAEQMKLDQIIRFATSSRCRQLEILEYFGDPERSDCNNCDNCDRHPIQANRASQVSQNLSSQESLACLYAAQVSLSGVARSQGRVGKSLIAQMLTGSESKKVKDLKLNKLSTFGLLKSLRQADVTSLLEALIERGFLQQIESTKFRPIVKITASGHELMTGKLVVDFAQFMPKALVQSIKSNLRDKKPVITKAKGTAAENAATVSISDSERQQSVEKRLPVKDEDDNPPAVREPTISVDSSFEYSVVEFDTSKKFERSQLNATDNFDAEFESFDHEVLDDSYYRLDLGETGSELLSRPSMQRSDLPVAGALTPTFFWTVQLLMDGYTVEHVAQIRHMDQTAILDHVMRGLEEGTLILPEQVLDPDKITLLSEFLQNRSGQPIGRLLAELPNNILPTELMYFKKIQTVTNCGILK